jgi:Tfp pilus assembly protein PilF
MMEDGTAPPDTVVLELVCGGQPRPQAYTDRKGQFSFEVGKNNTMITDASTSGPFGAGMNGQPGASGGGGGDPIATIPGPGGRGISERDIAGCDLRGRLSGYRSDSLPLGARRSLDHPDVGTLVLHPLTEVSGFTYSMTTAQAPKDAKKWYEKGMGQADKGKAAEAEVSFSNAVAAYPKFAAAWQELGLAYEELKNDAKAEGAYRHALEADPKFVLPYLRLAAIETRQRKWPEALESTNQVIKMDPIEFPEAYFLNAVANFNLKNLDEAEKSAQEAIKLDPHHKMPKAYHVLGVIQAQKADYTGALGSMNNYLSFASPEAADREMVKKQISEIEKIKGKQTTVQK